MADQAGVYASFRTPAGFLVSSSRDTWAEVKDDLSTIFGDEWVEGQIIAIRGGASQTASVAQPPQQKPVPAEAPVGPTVVSSPDVPTSQPAPTVAEAPVSPEEAAAILGGTLETQEQSFDTCDAFLSSGQLCGSVKDKWNGPGISKAGKKYPGFFGCPNFRDHRR